MTFLNLYQVQLPNGLWLWPAAGNRAQYARMRLKLSEHKWAITSLKLQATSSILQLSTLLDFVAASETCWLMFRQELPADFLQCNSSHHPGNDLKTPKHYQPPSPPLGITATPATCWILHHWSQPFLTMHLASFLPTSHCFGFKDTIKCLARIKVRNIHWIPLIPITIHLISRECPYIVFPNHFLILHASGQFLGELVP